MSRTMTQLRNPQAPQRRAYTPSPRSEHLTDTARPRRTHTFGAFRTLCALRAFGASEAPSAVDAVDCGGIVVFGRRYGGIHLRYDCSCSSWKRRRRSGKNSRIYRVCDLVTHLRRDSRRISRMLRWAGRVRLTVLRIGCRRVRRGREYMDI